MPNSPSTIEEFLDKLPADRAFEVRRVRELIIQNLPKGYQEVVSKGMLVYQVPLEIYPDTYNRQPLWYVALASQKNYLSLYLMAVYGDQNLLTKLKDGFEKAGKRLKMGKSCINFKRADDLAFDALAVVIRTVSVNRLIEIAIQARKPHV
jgi:hypothetical protein